MNESLLAVIALFVLGAGPVLVIDALIIQGIRRPGVSPTTRAQEDRSIER